MDTNVEREKEDKNPRISHVKIKREGGAEAVRVAGEDILRKCTMYSKVLNDFSQPILWRF